MLGVEMIGYSLSCETSMLHITKRSRTHFLQAPTISRAPPVLIFQVSCFLKSSASSIPKILLTPSLPLTPAPLVNDSALGIAKMNPAHQQHPLPAANVNCFNVTNSYNTVEADHSSEVLKWLSPLEPRERHHDVSTRRLDDVGDWVLQTDEFGNWCSVEDKPANHVFFCYGSPGVGKTYLR